ncbi:hypothetical protein AC477_01650 [miscellaneous Crenarchaeota group-1 archaeon SG8-32-1]|uniref:DUF8091 domain-containing protein n=1 Tax=miscellaneous Crenarchaeota group-1 archaeon SG8-32-1 TaxID=1685124 RepID=A0A0M0BXV6_9ARCH|nr:MAG: hypothetical protein AC477_01650 [miscellaneous Crenarchaeota group-1 archaeon SG8-32-1]
MKEWYSALGGEVEVKVDDFIVDVLKDGLLIEIQTRNLSSIKKKIGTLLLTNKVRLVYPLSNVKWIVYVSNSGDFVRKRRSPKREKIVDLFVELVHLSNLVNDKNFSFEVLLIEEEELRCDDGKGSWRRRGVSIKDRKLVKVFDRVVFEDRTDFLKILPTNVGVSFTNKVLAKELGISIRLAQKITYCLRKMNLLIIDGKKKRELIFRVHKEVCDQGCVIK